MLTLAAAALLAGGTALAQTGSAPQQPMNNGGTPGSANSTNSNMPNSSTSGMPMSGSAGMGAASGATQDRTFAKKALAGGMAEVQLGQLAQQKSSSEDVKQFGQRMVDDHTKLGDQLKPIAASMGIQPPADLMPKDKKLMMKLQALSGDAFDKAYITAMLKDHKEDDKDFQMEASMGQNPQEKEAATQGDVVIKQHLQMAEDMAKAHNVMGGKGM